MAVHVLLVFVQTEHSMLATTFKSLTRQYIMFCEYVSMQDKVDEMMD